MDIRTLLTETKPVQLKRKVSSLSPAPIRSSPSSAQVGKVSSTTAMDITFDGPASLLTTQPNKGVKKVKFTLNGLESRSLNLNISPNDPPSAITSTVKDFFALHTCGVSFTDGTGCILIITPDNLTDNMEVFVNQTGLGEGEKNKKRKKSSLSSRKRTSKFSVESEDLEVEVEEDSGEKESSEQVEHNEKREKILSSDVSVENILDSTRRRLPKFSSEVYSLGVNY